MLTLLLVFSEESVDLQDIDFDEEIEDVNIIVGIFRGEC